MLAPRIVEAIGPHRCYFEPFCGSLAVLLAKPPVPMETAFDLHGDLINLVRCLADEHLAERLYDAAGRMLPCQDLHRETKRRLEQPIGPTPDVLRAKDFLYNSWLGRNGVIGTSQFNNNFCVRYTSNGGAPATRWRSAVESIPAWHDRLRSVMILNTCGIAACEKIEDRDGTVIYADPPYLVKGAKYRHDFEAADHLRLAAALRRFTKTKVVVSYYADERLAELYPSWRQIDATVTKSLVNQGCRDGTVQVKAPEVLLVNGEVELNAEVAA